MSVPARSVNRHGSGCDLNGCVALHGHTVLVVIAESLAIAGVRGVRIIKEARVAIEIGVDGFKDGAVLPCIRTR